MCGFDVGVDVQGSLGPTLGDEGAVHHEAGASLHHGSGTGPHHTGRRLTWKQGGSLFPEDSGEWMHFYVLDTSGKPW